MVSHYFCVMSSKVCPTRHALLVGHGHEGSNWSSATNPSSAQVDSAERLQMFLLGELDGPATTSINQLVARMERLATLLQRTGRYSRVENAGTATFDLKALSASVVSKPEQGKLPCDRLASAHHHSQTTILLSRYEHMVDDFRGWIDAFVFVLPNVAALSRQDLRSSLFAAFARDFVVDGGHRHSLKPGSNLERLRSHALAVLSDNERLSSLLYRLGYNTSSPHADALPTGWASSMGRM
jgi:hypothetical protein